MFLEIMQLTPFSTHDKFINIMHRSDLIIALKYLFVWIYTNSQFQNYWISLTRKTPNSRYSDKIANSFDNWIIIHEDEAWMCLPKLSTFSRYSCHSFRTVDFPLLHIISMFESPTTPCSHSIYSTPAKTSTVCQCH